jgi:hypothetical protein
MLPMLAWLTMQQIPHKFEAEQKELYQSLTKYGKIVDKVRASVVRQFPFVL